MYGSVPKFLKAGRPDGPTCLVLDVRLPGQGGLDFQREQSQAGFHLPIIFITGHGTWGTRRYPDVGAGNEGAGGSRS